MNLRHRVIWRRSLQENALPAFVSMALRRGEDANSIIRAVRDIDWRLQFEPETQGESRENYERILIVSPLSVTYEVFEEEGLVVILGVRYSPPHPPES